jgi:hypothetical protein
MPHHGVRSTATTCRHQNLDSLEDGTDCEPLIVRHPGQNKPMLYTCRSTPSTTRGPRHHRSPLLFAYRPGLCGDRFDGFSDGQRSRCPVKLFRALAYVSWLRG